jgi:hypothetical protein
MHFSIPLSRSHCSLGFSSNTFYRLHDKRFGTRNWRMDGELKN